MSVCVCVLNKNSNTGDCGPPCPLRPPRFQIACCTFLNSKRETRKYVSVVQYFAFDLGFTTYDQRTTSYDFAFLCAHSFVLMHSSGRTNRSTGFPPTMCDSMISSMSSAFTRPYQTCSG